MARAGFEPAIPRFSEAAEAADKRTALQREDFPRTCPDPVRFQGFPVHLGTGATLQAPNDSGGDAKFAAGRT